MAQQSEIRYLTPPTVEVKKKKYCRFKKAGIKVKSQLGKLNFSIKFFHKIFYLEINN